MVWSCSVVQIKTPAACNHHLILLAMHIACPCRSRASQNDTKENKASLNSASYVVWLRTVVVVTTTKYNITVATYVHGLVA